MKISQVFCFFQFHSFYILVFCRSFEFVYRTLVKTAASIPDVIVNMFNNLENLFWHVSLSNSITGKMDFISTKSSLVRQNMSHVCHITDGFFSQIEIKSIFYVNQEFSKLLYTFAIGWHCQISSLWTVLTDNRFYPVICIFAFLIETIFSVMRFLVTFVFSCFFLWTVFDSL